MLTSNTILNKKVKERWEFRFGPSILGYLCISARRAGRNYNPERLPDHVRRYLNVPDKGRTILRDFKGKDGKAHFEKLFPKFWQWNKMYIEHDVPRLNPFAKGNAKRAQINLQAILSEHSAENLGTLYRHAYKYTDCGASIGAEIYRNGKWVWVYGNDLYNVKQDEPVIALCVSSIVEGVDQTTETYFVELMQLKTRKLAVKAYNEALQHTEMEAKDIWNNSHGCETCAKHWDYNGEFGSIKGNDGMTPVWDECPECHGGGSII